MTSIGESLRQERLRRDLQLEQISRELKISSRFLEAIESESFDRLPGGVFAKSFVRQYARYLGLDDDEYAAAVQQVVEPRVTLQTSSSLPLGPVDIGLPRVEEWQSVSDRRFHWFSALPALGMVVVVMLLCSGVYTWWQRSRRSAQLHQERPPAVKTTHASAAPPAAQTTPAPAPQVAVPPSDVTSQPPTGSATSAPPAVPSVAEANRPAPDATAIAQAPTQSPAPATPQPPPEPSNPDAAVKVDLAATEPVWMEARADGKVLFSGTLDANQTRTLQASGPITLRLGNAGGINVMLNGKPIGPLGPKGQVRTLQLTPGGFQIVAAPKPSAPAPPDPL